MKSFVNVFLFIMLTISFTALVFPRKTGKYPHGQILIQEKIMHVERGLQLRQPGNEDDKLFRSEKRLTLLKELGSSGVKFSEILSDTIYIMISYVWKKWDIPSSEWVNYRRYTYTFDANGNLMEYLFRTWDGSAWVNDGRYIYTYDANGNLAEGLDQYWDGSAWANTGKHTYTLDVNGNQTEYIFRTWDGSVWTNDSRFTYTYDIDSNLTEELSQYWDGIEWVNEARHINIYDVDGHVTEKVKQVWDGAAWVDNEKYVYTYNGNITQMLEQKWNGSNWVNYWKDTYSYNPKGDQTEKLSQLWYGSAWVNIGKTTYTYDGNGNKTEELVQNWVGSAWVNNNRYTYTWQMLITEVNERVNDIGDFVLSENYPNPFNPQTNISFSVPRESYISLKIYDLLGREVTTLIQEKKQQGKYSVSWNAEGVPSGIYFYRIVAGGFIETKKMVLVK